MAAPGFKTNQELIFDCIEDLLKSITHANGYRTDGYLVARGRDPRALREHLPEKYEEKQAAITVQRVSKVRDQKRSLSGKIWWEVKYQLLILRTLTTVEDDAGRTIDELESDTEDDIVHAIGTDPGLVHAAGRLGITVPHIEDHQVDDFQIGDAQWHPDTHIVANCSFLYGEPRINKGIA